MNILIAGVGGQGTLLASKVLGKYAMHMNMDCKVSEVHGMAQRGGSVVTHFKMDKKIYSPLVELGSADVLLSFEKLETLRYLDYLKSDGKIIYSTHEIYPMSVINGDKEYPQMPELKNATAVDAHKIALSLNNARVANTVMLGQLTKQMNFDYAKMLDSLFTSIPLQLGAVNKEAFELGYNL